MTLRKPIPPIKTSGLNNNQYRDGITNRNLTAIHARGRFQMSATFHFAVPAGDLSITERFYVEVLGCATGNREVGRWVDIDFWGNELTLHQSTEMLPSVRHDVDMGKVKVPHFGVHLSEEDFQRVKLQIEDSSFNYLQEPYRRFIGTEFEQETFFIEDPNGNILELKTLVDPDKIFAMK